MKLRDRLFLFSSTQLLLLGLLFLVVYVQFRRGVLPVLKEHLQSKAVNTVSSLGSQLDVALGLGDSKVIAGVVAHLPSDPDFRRVEVRDPSGALLFEGGERAGGLLTAGAPKVAHENDETVRAWMPVSLEGLDLGTVSVVFDKARMERLRVWSERLGLLATLIWLAALAYTFRFSRAFVSPIHHMMEFSRRVAGGRFNEQLSCGGSGELKELEDHLNTMARELESREEQRQAAAVRAEALQRELLSVSRMAGMAEVASGVLHNVGNVLNSLNVSVSVVGDKVRGSKVATLARSVQLYEDYPGGMPAFLSSEKGKVLPQYLATISKHLAEENAAILRELSSVADNVEHIKTIVMTQQSYARLTGHRESVKLAELLDDALRMAESSFARHDIHLTKEYDDVPEITTDRHKLLQIIVNLVSNARHALKSLPVEGGRLTVRVQRNGDRLAIAIQDTGVGIPAENMGRIFQHGFTTKVDGHGFGLHSSANAARELGGFLSAASDGPGQGATFTLDLPLTAPDKAHVLPN